MPARGSLPIMGSSWSGVGSELAMCAAFTAAISTDLMGTLYKRWELCNSSPLTLHSHLTSKP